MLEEGEEEHDSSMDEDNNEKVTR